MTKTYKLDIFEVLKAIDRNDSNWLMRQPDDARKAFAPVVAMVWAATCKSNSDQAASLLWMINERVNRHLYDLYKHPDLVFRLLASCSTGQSHRRQYLSSNQKHKSNQAMELLAQHHPHANYRELQMLLSLHTKQSFTEFVVDCGIPRDEAKNIIQSFEANAKIMMRSING